MGHYETAYWESDAGAPTRHDRMSGEYHPYVLDEFTYYERALATELGDTRIEKPCRPVPQRPR